MQIVFVLLRLLAAGVMTDGISGCGSPTAGQCQRQNVKFVDHRDSLIQAKQSRSNRALPPAQKYPEYQPCSGEDPHRFPRILFHVRIRSNGRLFGILARRNSRPIDFRSRLAKLCFEPRSQCCESFNRGAGRFLDQRLSVSHNRFQIGHQLVLVTVVIKWRVIGLSLRADHLPQFVTACPRFSISIQFTSPDDQR